MRKYGKAKILKNPWDIGPFKTINSAAIAAIDFKATFLFASGAFILLPY